MKGWRRKMSDVRPSTKWRRKMMTTCSSKSERDKINISPSSSPLSSPSSLSLRRRSSGPSLKSC
ncbi:unnamed protein product [Thlaspi arvense]|uniref:Uncharacterized protein n=1 Tax=Thlaspi arvense TaxID=13288 RepID=A0AAU9RN17_THLAR|nr:unnamed protein product [Thlaspi arvense]